VLLKVSALSDVCLFDAAKRKKSGGCHSTVDEAIRGRHPTTAAVSSSSHNRTRPVAVPTGALVRLDAFV
jgi:hypothetical protein